MIAFAPLSIMPLMSLFSCCTFDCAFVVSSFQPLALAASTCDLVEAIRNGLASFSDCAQPIVSVLKSILPMPRSEPLQIGPYSRRDALGHRGRELLGAAGGGDRGRDAVLVGAERTARPRRWARAAADEAGAPLPAVWPVLQAASSTSALADRTAAEREEDLRRWTMTTFPLPSLDGVLARWRAVCPGIGADVSDNIPPLPAKSSADAAPPENRLRS